MRDRPISSGARAKKLASAFSPELQDNARVARINLCRKLVCVIAQTFESLLVNVEIEPVCAAMSGENCVGPQRRCMKQQMRRNRKRDEDS